MEGTFGTRLSDIIKLKGLSQKEVAMKAGVTEAAMSHYVKGDRMPRASVLSRIADVLGTTSDYLMSGATYDMQEEVDYTKRLIARNATKMTHEDKLEIISILLGKE